MDWNTVLGWGSPIGLGVFFLGLGMLCKCIIKMNDTYTKKWKKIKT